MAKLFNKIYFYPCLIGGGFNPSPTSADGTQLIVESPQIPQTINARAINTTTISIISVFRFINTTDSISTVFDIRRFVHY